MVEGRMSPIRPAKAQLKSLLSGLVVSVRDVVLDRPRVRAVLRFLGDPLIRLMMWAARPAPPTVWEPVLRLPLDYEPVAQPLSAAVLLHAYNVQVLPEMADLLRRLPFPAELVVTTDTEDKRTAVEAAFAGWSLGRFEVRVTPNRGRNIGPQLIACRDVFERAELVLILHTKVSHHADALAGWRKFLLRDLIGSPAVARGVMETFAQLPKLGVLAPRTFPLVRRQLIWGDNYPICRALAERLGFPLFPDSALDFPAGFMFWARSAALQPLLDLDLDWDDFEPEPLQHDGSTAHALERLVFYASELAGYRWARAGVEVDAAMQELFYAASTPRMLSYALTERSRTVLLPGRPPTPTAGTDAQTLQAASDPQAALRAACAEELDDFLIGAERLALPTGGRPAVSIVLTLHNQVELAFEGLRALKHALDLPCEVILVDNAGSDRMGRLLERIDGAKILRDGETIHPVRRVNLGVDLAVGRHLLLLNSGARLSPGSIAAAVERLEAEADLGAVGGGVTLCDGTLQEAGGVIWRDGGCLGYGRGDDPWAAEFQFRRDVDYCSGGFLMVRRDLFERLDRLDEAYASAGYEDADLCMRMRNAGYRISYDPRVRLARFDSASTSHSPALQAAHQKFVERHAEALRRGHAEPGTPPLWARMRGGDRGRLLIVDDQIPYPQLGSNYARALDTVRAAHAAGWFVTYFPLSHPDADYAAAYWVLPPDVELAAERGRAGLAAFMRARAGYYDAALVSWPHNMECFRAALAQVPAFIEPSQVVYDAEGVAELARTRRPAPIPFRSSCAT